MGGQRMYQNYAVGWAWAMTTPFQWVKQISSHLGGVRNGMVLSWPERSAGGGAVRSQFSHVNDVLPTILDAAGIAAPATVNGVAQQPLDGVSLLPTLADAKAPEPHRTQYFEVTANRSIYHDGWWANTKPRRMPWQDEGLPGRADTSYEWELYDLRTDFSQAKDLAASQPQKLAEMQAVFDGEARKNNIYPLDDRFAFTRGVDSAIAKGQHRNSYRYRGKDVSVALYAAPALGLRSF